MKLALKIASIGVLISACTAALFFLWWHPSQAEHEITWGVDYSESQAAYLGLDPQETYLAIIHDLGAKNIKIHIDWNSIEPKKGEFDFSTLDVQVKEAEENNVHLILVVGMKTGRWPECHQPEWFDVVGKDQRESELLKYTSAVVERYKDSSAIEYWQVENEPLLQFGTCPSWYYTNGTALLEAEVAAVKSLDPSRKIIISDSGELSTWTDVAPIADIVGVTMYRSSWSAKQKTFGINAYSFLTPEFYAAKAAFIQNAYHKPVISIELQAEPWASKPLPQSSLAEQEQSMNPQLFAENIAFAKEVGLGRYYFWGVEWWYWLKVKHAKPEIWDEAKQLFAQ